MAEEIAQPQREPRSVSTGAAGGRQLPTGDVIYRMSGFMRVAPIVFAVLYLPLVYLMLAMPRHPDDTMTGVVAVAVLLVGVGSFMVLAGRGWIRVSHRGVLARNIVTQMWIPWSAVTQIEASAKVGFRLWDDRIWWCWAVQRANITAMLDRTSRVDRVVAEMEVLRAVAADSQAQDSPRRTIVQPAWWEWAIIGGYTVAAVAGLLSY